MTIQIKVPHLQFLKNKTMFSSPYKLVSLPNEMYVHNQDVHLVSKNPNIHFRYHGHIKTLSIHPFSKPP